MDFWSAQRESVQRRIAELEGKIELERQKMHSPQADTAEPMRLIAIFKASIVRENLHAKFIEHRTAAERTEPSESVSGSNYPGRAPVPAE
jgi:hypothetical protein